MIIKKNIIIYMSESLTGIEYHAGEKYYWVTIIIFAFIPITIFLFYD